MRLHFLVLLLFFITACHHKSEPRNAVSSNSSEVVEPALVSSTIEKEPQTEDTTVDSTGRSDRLDVEGIDTNYLMVDSLFESLEAGDSFVAYIE